MSDTGAAEISDEHEALIQFLYLAPVGLIQAALDGTIAMINPISAQLLMPLSRDGSLCNLFTALENVAPALRHLCADFSGQQGVICDAMYLHLNGESPRQDAGKVLSLSVVKLDDTRLMAVLSDVTQQVARERALRQADAWLNAILTNVTDYALISLDRDGRVDAWNESIGRLMGHSADALLGQPYSIFYPPGATTDDHLLDRLREADADGWSLDEGLRMRADGSRFWGSAMIAPMQQRGAPADAGDCAPVAPAYCLIIRDISDKREASERQRLATFRDYLTGLANRRAFFEAAERELARSKQSPRPTSMIMFDADHFKAINERFGHAAGDGVLCHFAAALRSIFRDVDVVARVGGEEFAVLLPSTGLADAAAVADRLRLSVEAACVNADGEAIRYTVSAGVATMDDSQNGLDGLMQRADQALYAAKARGRNRVDCWTPDCPSYKDHLKGRSCAE
jgi:diguanylate cyclase (GGDEF)-like protein/PAS domain S-box-containing protein